MADIGELGLALPQTTKEVSEDARPTYLVHGKMFCFHRSPRADALDANTGARRRTGTATPPCWCASRISSTSTATSCATSSSRRG